ncbi:Growth arrest-specific protein 8 [Vigna unguiculata]|uniref:Growth arrest-specific protein 8 n=1 Tax=Vigna unguiculata TaxID=3917 RepID=A0A4D6MB04_VIGUN|nr:Growth arrest-specific protein 8 [Vigna unguiculata]
MHSKFQIVFLCLTLIFTLSDFIRTPDALSQRELLRRIKQQESNKVGASSRTKDSSLKAIALESEQETTQSDPKSKRKRTDPLISETSDSTDNIPLSALSFKKSFWDEKFTHLAYGRTNNYFPIDDKLLSGRQLSSVQEGLLRSIHQVEASSLFLVGRLEASERKESKAVSDLVAANKEIEQLRVDLVNFAKVKKALEDKETELSTLKAEMDELKPKAEGLSARCQALEGEKEELTDQLCSTLKEGFQLALDQVKILHPDIDISSADITKEIVDGQLIELS